MRLLPNFPHLLGYSAINLMLKASNRGFENLLLAIKAALWLTQHIKIIEFFFLILAILS